MSSDLQTDKRQNDGTHIACADTTVVNLDLDVIVAHRLGLEVDQFEVVPFLGVFNAKSDANNSVPYPNKEEKELD